jgi:hypothetical protein
MSGRNAPVTWTTEMLTTLLLAGCVASSLLTSVRVSSLRGPDRFLLLLMSLIHRLVVRSIEAPSVARQRERCHQQTDPLVFRLRPTC